MADIVLLHGTTQTAAGYAALIQELTRLGHRVLAPDIPSGAATTAAGYADLLAARLPADLDRPVVVAHSASGLLLPALARRLDAGHQVWLAAAVADQRGGRSLMAEIQEDPHAVFHPEWLGVDPTSDPDLAVRFLFHDAAPAEREAALETVALCDLSAVYTEVPVEDPGRLPSTYLLPTADRALQQSWMAAVARERLRTEPVEIRSASHNFYTSQPARTASVIDAVA